MPMTDEIQSGEPSARDCSASPIAKDERLTAMVSAYLDGELRGKELEEFEALLRDDQALAREIAEIRQIELQLAMMGADILEEPIPQAILDALSPLARKP
jgi:anti-sigma factor RsiW